MISKSLNVPIKTLALAAAALMLGACAAGEGTRDNPVLRKFQWFSYLEGGDFKAACQPGAPDLYRMIYNGVYTEQVRMYELSPQAGTLSVRVVGPEDLTAFGVSSLNDVLNPWRGEEAVTQVSPADSADVVRDLEASGAFDAPNVGAELSSKGFFWTMASCHEGAYHFTGVAWPSPQWDRIRFAERLFALDRTGIAVNEPRRTRTERDMAHSRKNSMGPYVEFHLKVGESGLAAF